MAVFLFYKIFAGAYGFKVSLATGWSARSPNLSAAPRPPSGKPSVFHLSGYGVRLVRTRTKIKICPTGIF